MYHKARHIDTRVYHLRELCRDGVMELVKVSSGEQAADSLTKATTRAIFVKHCAVMLGDQGRMDDRTRPTDLEGTVDADSNAHSGEEIRVEAGAEP